jgi:hypothetical protein
VLRTSRKIIFCFLLPRENYVFACACERCDEETMQPDVTSDEDMDDDDDDDAEQ